MTSTLRPATIARVLETEDPNLILIVEAKVNAPEAPKNALQLPHNRDRYVPPEYDLDDEIQSWEITPFLDKGDDAAEAEEAHRLCLIFDKLLKKIE